MAYCKGQKLLERKSVEGIELVIGHWPSVEGEHRLRNLRQQPLFSIPVCVAFKQSNLNKQWANQIWEGCCRSIHNYFLG